MMHKIEKKEKKYVIGISVRTSNQTFPKDVPPLWHKFSTEKLTDKIPNKVHQNIMAVYTDYEGDFTKPFTYIIGHEVSNLSIIPEGMIGIEIPTQSYAIFIAKGPFPYSMFFTWQTIWKANIRRTYTTDYELYPENFQPQSNPEIKIYVAVQ